MPSDIQTGSESVAVTLCETKYRFSHTQWSCALCSVYTSTELVGWWFNYS